MRKMHVFEAEEIDDATDSFSPSRLIGKGSHGSVYKGILNDGRHVAVKKQSLALTETSKLQNEALILSSIPPNPCTVNLIGVTSDRTIIVTDFMPNGTLHHLLHHSAAPPPWHKRLEIALQLAKGLSCLHESKPSIVHRDIKSANILFDNNWNALLADFGLAARLRDCGVETKLPAGTIGYIDPRYTTPNKLTPKIDVFSYGVVLLELVSGRKVMELSESPASIVDWALPLIEEGRATEICDRRMRWSRREVTELMAVAARCVSWKESKRPSMREVRAILERLQMEGVRCYNPAVWVNCVGEMIGWMMRGKKSRVSGAMVTGGACADDDGNDDFQKGRLLVRDITFK